MNGDYFQHLKRELEKAKSEENKEAVVEGKRRNIQGNDPDEVAKLREENMVRYQNFMMEIVQYTYELELKTYNKKRVGAEKQLMQAKEAVRYRILPKFS